jgi:hypothetical protein
MYTDVFSAHLFRAAFLASAMAFGVFGQSQPPPSRQWLADAKTLYDAAGTAPRSLCSAAR